MNDNEKTDRVEKESPKKIESPKKVEPTQDDLSALRSALKKEKEDKKLPKPLVEDKKKETKVEEDFNIDSLISSYKEESAGLGPKTDFLVDLLNEEDCDKENQSGKDGNESQREDYDVGIKSTRLSRNFKKDKILAKYSFLLIL